MKNKINDIIKSRRFNLGFLYLKIRNTEEKR
ncbi:hypothetical protein NT01CX_1279 [Clostridium novyi NT]|uniref:Uncharacterized protein n=1 Tax=Clostridium novyi (strain NT) TaxID=386415 RepID=A0PYB0_CLONN|nr:hypothetical protein NT01CX_1279 [Clostridium novyi NT]